jgi:hypothetical protein
MGTKTYDQKCADLAEEFLSDEEWYQQASFSDRPRYVEDLAGNIQETIEREIRHYRDSLHVGFHQ